MTTVRTEDHRPSGAVPLRVLVAVHGYEPPDWEGEAGRVVTGWVDATVRVLAVLDVPSAPFTSLTGFARRAYDGARAQWTALETRRLDERLHTLLPRLPCGAGVVHVPATQGALAETITEDADAWRADVVVVAATPPGLRAWLRPGPVHEWVVQLASCPVLVVRPPRVTVQARRLPAAFHAAATERRA
jgi:nucleotide-binding universal stress UspA family protein